MAGRTPSRILLCTLVVALLLPLASASAAPVRPREAALGLQLPEWSRVLQEVAAGLLDRFHSVFEREAQRPPGYNVGTDPSGHEGSGLDPHGKP